MDDTLTPNCFEDNELFVKIMNILHHANKHNYSIYIVTARRFINHDNNSLYTYDEYVNMNETDKKYIEKRILEYNISESDSIYEYIEETYPIEGVESDKQYERRKEKLYGMLQSRGQIIIDFIIANDNVNKWFYCVDPVSVIDSLKYINENNNKYNLKNDTNPDTYVGYNKDNFDRYIEIFRNKYKINNMIKMDNTVKKTFNFSLYSLIKIYQITKIKENHPNVDWNNFYFFDDSKSHMLAVEKFATLTNNNRINNLNVIGGNDECVSYSEEFKNLQI